MCTLEHFMEDSKIESVRIVRFKSDSASTIAKKALYYLKQKTPFDENFNINDTTSFFCSELPIHIIKSGFDIDIAKNAAKPKFSVFINPSLFEEIPFVIK